MQEPLVTKAKEESVMTVNKRLYLAWRSFLIASSSLAMLAIIPAALDYELGYSSARGHDSCAVEANNMYRGLAMTLSLLAVSLLIPYRIYFLKWRRQTMLTFVDLPSLKPVSLTEVMAQCRSPRLYQFIDFNTVGLAVLFLIVPYPELNVSFTVKQTMIEQTSVCYYLSEIFYVLMYARVVVWFLHLSMFTKYQTLSAIRHCDSNGVEPSASFSTKSVLNENPILSLFILIVPSLFIFALALRVFERPARFSEDENNLEHLENGFWNIFITMTTVGYGDVFPVTALGRFVCCLAAIWGGVVLSILFATVGAFLALEDNQKKAYSSIIVSKAAADVIQQAFLHRKTRASKNSVTEIKRWDKLRKKIIIFKHIREANGLVGSEESRLDNIESNIKALNSKMDEFQKGLDQLLAR